MFYDVKILDSKGQTKKIISAQELSQRHWQSFKSAEENKTLNSSGRKQVPGWVKKKLDMDYSHFRERPALA